MRRITWVLLLLFASAIPWEYSLDLGGLFGNAARIAGLLVLLAAVPAILQAGRMRAPGAFWWLTLALFLWFCCSYFWTIDPVASLEKIRGYFQEMMIVWLVWEFTDTPTDLRALLRATVAGSWVLALLTLAPSVRLKPSRRARFVSPLMARTPTKSPAFSILAFRLQRFSSTANVDGSRAFWRWASTRLAFSQSCLPLRGKASWPR